MLRDVHTLFIKTNYSGKIVILIVHVDHIILTDDES